MKTSLLDLNKSFLIFLIICCFYSCDGPKCYHYGRVLEVTPFHATRVNVKYISKCNDTINTSEHSSVTIYADNITFDVADYLNGTLKYGAVE